MIRRPPRSTQSRSSAASDVYKRQVLDEVVRQANELWGVGLVVISAGRARGYLYIDWDGKVMPCVFAPYAALSLQDVFARGGNLNDVSFVPGTSVSFAGRSQVEDHVW